MKRTVPCTTDSVLQRAYNEQAEQLLLSAFSKGIMGTAGRQLRYASPANVEEALRIAVTVSQAEIQEARDSAFYLDAEIADPTPAVHHTAARKSAESTSQSRKPSRVSERQPRTSTSKGQSDKPSVTTTSVVVTDTSHETVQIDGTDRRLVTRRRTLNRELARERLMNHVVGRIMYMDFALRSQL